MNRFERMFSILLRLRADQSISATELARSLEVSRRTIYRDVEVLTASGIPIYAEHGREGGFRLGEGYFLPPLMFSRDEGAVVLMGLTLLRSLATKPLEGEIETVTKKLLAALPERLRKILAAAERIVGFEEPPSDIFHPEMISDDGVGPTPNPNDEGQAVDVFMRAILESHTLTLEYHSPHHAEPKAVRALPLGIFLDRGHWYLVGDRLEPTRERRTWRADRVTGIKANALANSPDDPDFDVRALLGRNWLASAMVIWRENRPVKIRLSRVQAARLRQDWYYQYAQYEEIDGDKIMMTIGEADSALVFELLRWLGPDAELIEPQAWRKDLKQELEVMLAKYST